MHAFPQVNNMSPNLLLYTQDAVSDSHLPWQKALLFPAGSILELHCSAWGTMLEM